MSIIKNKVKLVIFAIIGALSFLILIIYLNTKRGLSGRLPESGDDIGDRYSAYVPPTQTVTKRIGQSNNVINNYVREPEK